MCPPKNSTVARVSDSTSDGQAFDSSLLLCSGIHVRCSVNLGTRIRWTSSGYSLSIYVINKIHFRTPSLNPSTYFTMYHKYTMISLIYYNILKRKIAIEYLEKYTHIYQIYTIVHIIRTVKENIKKYDVIIILDSV